MGRRYKNPPIIEAVCEFRFERGSPWDLTIPGLIYEKVRDGFPKRKQAKQVQIEISAVTEGLEQQVTTTDRMRFLREDEKVLIQVGPDLLAVNHLKPYPSWREFQPLIEKGFKAYSETTNPKGIRRIGLRYINRIEIPNQGELKDYFSFYPFIGKNWGEILPQKINSFISGIQIPYENSRDILRLKLGSARAETSDTSGVILDLDYFLAESEDVPLDKKKVFEWINFAHNHIEEVFEACITDRLRQMFEEVKE